MKEVPLDYIKRIQLEILDDVHEFCVKNGLRYSLCGGSLLGAVKHKGYVPYDDDIDIMMPRQDYEFFVSKYQSDRNFVLDMRKMDSCRELFSKVCRKGTLLVDPILGRTTFSIFIDVCPVDGAPDDRQQYYSEISQLIDGVPRLCAFYKAVPNHKLIWFSKYLVKRFILGKGKDVLSLKQEIHECLSKNVLELSPFAGELVVCRSKEDMIDSRVFMDYREYEFEGHCFMGISDYDTYLTMKYSYLGDYMHLPPLKKPLHEYTAYVE